MTQINQDRAEQLKKARESRTYVGIEYNPIIQSSKAPSSLKKRIKAMCGHCMGCTEDHIEAGWRDQVRDCSAPKCPLYDVRPYKREQL